MNQSTLHVLAESNLCKRLFSRSKFILGDRRRRMTTNHLEMLLLLNFNRHLWDVETVQHCMVRASTDDRRIPTEGVDDDETPNDGVENSAKASNTLNEDDAIIEPSRFDEMEWSVPPATNPNESESP